MARSEKNPNQIVRLDGKNCFMESMKNAFEIGKFLWGFYQYDKTRAQGSKFTSEILVYLNPKDFDNLYYDILINGSLIKKINALANDPTKKEYEKQVVIHRGGTEKDGRVIARQLKIFKGRAKDIVLRAEYGPGQRNSMGGYTMTGSPEKYVDIGMTYEDMKLLLLETKRAWDAHSVKESMKDEISDLEFELNKTKKMLELIAKSVNVNNQELQNIINEEKPKPTYGKNQSQSANNQGYNNQSYGSNSNNYSNGYSNQNYGASNGYSNQGYSVNSGYYDGNFGG
jgi:hypothetical protein